MRDTSTHIPAPFDMPAIRGTANLEQMKGNRFGHDIARGDSCR